jgi:hypothetical protein
MRSRGVWVSVESLLEDSEGELDKSLLVRRYSPMLYKGKLNLREDKRLAQGHTASVDQNPRFSTPKAYLPALLRSLLHFVFEIIKISRAEHFVLAKGT